jgi:hypothetical protein
VFRQQQKSFKVVFGKWVKAKEMDAAAIKKTRDAITAVKAAHFTRVAPRGISHDVLTEKYAKIAVRSCFLSVLIIIIILIAY